MDPEDQSAAAAGDSAGSSGAFASAGGAAGVWSEGQPAPRAYQRCDGLTEALIHVMVLGSPWAFGTTQPWSLWLMNTVGYLLGFLLVAKRCLRRSTGYRPARWGEEVCRGGGTAVFRPHTRMARWLTRSLALLTALFLAYCLVSALNARAAFVAGVQTFNDNYVRWLPHSYASSQTWGVFWKYLGLAGFFWAARDWLLGKTARERGEAGDDFPQLAPPAPAPLPERLTRLLWALCLNATLLGLVSILQRLDGTEKLLWLLQPRSGGADFHFGPFNYRGNGAQYFNLIWPVSLAFWWTLFRAARTSRRADARVGSDPHLVLLPCVLVQAACPVISASHGGAVITAGLAVGALGLLLAANWRTTATMRVALLLPFGLGLLLVLYLGWNQFQAGFTNAFVDDLGDRIEIYENARQMAVDHPLLGTGPGTFSAMYQLYRASPRQDWAAYAHDDWLESVITLGWIGFGLLLLMLAHVLVRWWVRDGLPCRWDLVGMIWLSLAGCLFHARFDFPLQIYSLLLLFLLLACVACSAARQE